MSAESGATWERSASFSVAPGASTSAGSGYVVPAAAPSLLQSIYTWWGAAPLPTPALLSEREDGSVSFAKEGTATSAADPTSSTAVSTASTPVPVCSNNVEAVGTNIAPSNTTGLLSAHSSTASMASTLDTAESASSLKSATSSIPASPARAPVNKIAERLQKIRVQKLPPT